MVIWLLYWVTTLICWVYALLRGGPPVQWAFIFFVFASALSLVSTWPDAGNALSNWHGLNPILFFADSIYLAALCVIAVWSRRYWPIWSAGLHLLCVLGHFGPIVDPFVSPKIFRAFETFWALPMLATMVIGVKLDHAGRVVSREFARTG